MLEGDGAEAECLALPPLHLFVFLNIKLIAITMHLRPNSEPFDISESFFTDFKRNLDHDLDVEYAN